MSTEQRKVPELRFKGFVDDWEQRKLGEVSSKVTEKNTEANFEDVFTNSAEFGIISQESYFDKKIANSKSIAAYYVVRPNDFIYNPRISSYAPVGPIKRNNTKKIGIMSPLYYVFRTSSIDVLYLEKYFDSNHWHRFMFKNGDSGVRSDRFAIKDNVFNQMIIPFPNLDEQEAIGKMIQGFDRLITLHQRKLNIFKLIKHSYLINLFSNNMKQIPSLKFEKTSGIWKKHKMKDVLTVSKEKNINNTLGRNEVLSVSRELGTVNQIEYQGRSFAGSNISNYKVVKEGQMIYTKSPLKGAPYGIFQTVSLNGIVSPLYAVYNSTEKTMAEFIALQLKDDNIATHYLAPLVTKGAKNTINVTDEGVLEGYVFVPELTEQKKIIILTNRLDNMINLHDNKICNLVNLKKEYLKKMFI